MTTSVLKRDRMRRRQVAKGALMYVRRLGGLHVGRSGHLYVTKLLNVGECFLCHRLCRFENLSTRTQTLKGVHDLEP